MIETLNHNTMEATKMISAVKFERNDVTGELEKVIVFEGNDGWKRTEINVIEENNDNFTKVITAESGEKFAVDLLDNVLYKLIPVNANAIVDSSSNIVTN